VKHTKRRYGPKEARDFAGRIQEIRKDLKFILPSYEPKSVKMTAFVASASGLSTKGKDTLRKHLGGIPLKILPISGMQSPTSASQNSETTRFRQPGEFMSG
jgi:hypothetical protein